MATNEKDVPLSYTDVSAPYGGQQPGYPPSAHPPAYPSVPPPQQQQQATGVLFVQGHGMPVAQTMLVVQNVRLNVQVPEWYPGLAFCRFAPGMMETIIRLSIVMMLLVLITLAGTTIHEESKVITDGILTVDATGWRGAAGWVIFVAIMTLVTAGIMLLLRFLNPKCFNNAYGTFGGLDITTCALAGIGLFIGCIITGVESAIAAEDFSDQCENNPYNPDNNRACEQLQKIYRLVVALTAINAFCMVLILILFVWDIVYISAGLNSKVPVPRGTNNQ